MLIDRDFHINFSTGLYHLAFQSHVNENCKTRFSIYIYRYIGWTIKNCSKKNGKFGKFTKKDFLF